MKNEHKLSDEWHDQSYVRAGFSAQRFYPNEDLLRFMGRNYSSIPHADRSVKKILEIGSGSCANLWMISREGFSAYGLDISPEAKKLGEKMLEKWGCNAELKVGSMVKLPWGDATFDAVVDIFSSYCLDEYDFKQCIKEVVRVLKPGGRFFSYTPGKKSDAFMSHWPSKMIDGSTLNGIYRDGSPFAGNHYPFRFIHTKDYQRILEENGFTVSYLETVTRTYSRQSESFEHVVVEAFR